MIHRDLLLDDLKKLATDLVDDLRERTDAVDQIRARVRGQYEDAHAAGRTDRTYEEWREDLLAQVAVGWVLATVFVRFCEDNGLYDTGLLSGPGDRRDLAGDHRADWLADHPAAGDREWLEEVFGRYREIPATSEVFGEHNPLWQFGPSDDGARSIVELWRRLDHDTGELRHDFTDPDLDTRFLGDLYQDLSEHAKKTYALLQTPEFVEEFILDRTLDPAIETFGLEKVRMIDPTCGSGHFLLGAFDRILEWWRKREPGTPIRQLVQRTLDAVNGVDINPFAVEIARFRLLVAALKVAAISNLADAPAFVTRVAVGDALLHGRRPGDLFTGMELSGSLLNHRYPTEAKGLANEVLTAGSYHVVVGNPPYINVKDQALREVYRTLYDSASGHYSLAVPFTERFFELAVRPVDAESAGYIGMITTNSFMKRQFGKKLIENFFPTVALTHIIDTSRAVIPGHGTPTVILLGRHRRPESDSIRAVLGIRGERPAPERAEDGKVWQSIVRLTDHLGEEDEFISVEDAPLGRYASHPWSLQGGAAPKLLAVLEEHAVQHLGEIATDIGRTVHTGEDEVYVFSPQSLKTRGWDSESVPLVLGVQVRDYIVSLETRAIFPYDASSGQVTGFSTRSLHWHMWRYRTVLRSRVNYGKTNEERGLEWWEYSMFFPDRFTREQSIAFPAITTHNHFTFDDGRKVFNRTAPVIKLSEVAGANDYLGLVGLLNSSVALFWGRQTFYDKGTGEELWERRIDWDASKLRKFPLVRGRPLQSSGELWRLCSTLVEEMPASLFKTVVPNQDDIERAETRVRATRGRMVAVQEELDWECYHLYGLTDDELTAPADQVPDLKKGERAFEIVLARKMDAGEIESTWFARHDSTPITELPEHWPEPYRRVVERRVELIGSDRSIRLLEKPEHKRRWNWDAWEDLQQDALETWLLDRLEAENFWSEHELMTTGRLADKARRDEDFVEAARLYAGRVDVNITDLVTSLVQHQAVPFAVGYRFNTSGLRRRREWEKVWDLQRQEDEVDARTELPKDDPQYLTKAQASRLKKDEGLDRIPVPPKYRKSDYSNNTAYKLRGRLDVPQERFISYPGTRKGADSTPVIGWAGWDHLAQARALAGHYAARKDQGAEEPELVALLAGLQELVPWLRQWHNDVDPAYGQRMGDFFFSFVETEARAFDRTVDDLKTWTPA